MWSWSGAGQRKWAISLNWRNRLWGAVLVFMCPDPGNGEFQGQKGQEGSSYSFPHDFLDKKTDVDDGQWREGGKLLYKLHSTISLLILLYQECSCSVTWLTIKIQKNKSQVQLLSVFNMNNVDHISRKLFSMHVSASCENIHLGHFHKYTLGRGSGKLYLNWKLDLNWFINNRSPGRFQHFPKYLCLREAVQQRLRQSEYSTLSVRVANFRDLL